MRGTNLRLLRFSPDRVKPGSTATPPRPRLHEKVRNSPENAEKDADFNRNLRLSGGDWETRTLDLMRVNRSLPGLSLYFKAFRAFSARFA